MLVVAVLPTRLLVPVAAAQPSETHTPPKYEMLVMGDSIVWGQGLLNYFLRAINCGAITEEEATRRTSITLDELRSGSFVKILKNRQN